MYDKSRIKTISLSANIEQEIAMPYSNVCIRNNTTGAVYASVSKDIEPYTNGVTTIQSGESRILRDIYNINDGIGKFYVVSNIDGKIELESANDVNFKCFSAKGGETTYDDTAIKADISNLQNEKADKSDVYTKTETDNKITEKVAEIVSDAPEDFNTLKEMSDWIASHENDASAMNSAIKANADSISALQSGKLDNNGIAVSAKKLQTARKINGVSFDGTTNITVPLTAGKVYNNSANKWGKVVDVEMIDKNRIYTVYLMVSSMNSASSGCEGYLRFTTRYSINGIYKAYLTWIWCSDNINIDNFKAVLYETENGVMFELWIKNGDSTYKGIAVTPIVELSGFGSIGNGIFKYYEVENNAYDNLPDYATEENTVTSSIITLGGKIKQAENDSNGNNIASKFENLEQQKVDNEIFVAENLIKCPYGSKHGTIGAGVTFTYDDDGVVHLVGTGTSTVEPFALVSGLTLSGTYTLSVDNADVYLRVLGIDESGGTHLIGSVINGEPTTFTIGSENENIYPSYKVVVRVIENKIYDSYFKPMLEIGSIAHRYQPYKLSRKAMRDDITVYNDIFVAENLIHYPYNNDTATSGGITFTDNEDGSIAVTGSVTKANTNYNYKLNPNEYTKLEIGQTYILNNCGDLDGDCYLRLFYKADNGAETYLASTKNGSYTFVATETINEVRIWITVNCDDTTKEFNNVIKPMLEVGSIAHRYQPYQLSKQSMRDDINTLMARLT